MITKHHPATTVLLLAIATAFPRLSAAWYGDGHVLATRLALAAAGTNLPPCIVHNTDILLHCVQDPDMFRKAPAPQLPAQEPPEHFIDLELIRGAALPATRPEYVRLCAATADPRKGPNSRVDPFDAGFLPYSIL
ncbi:MAG: hypothetical protein FJ224_11760, partial [Lentisphaerae bacterium]|nr:hypothetical protein [Lentisphaerota bacterium]